LIYRIEPRKLLDTVNI